MAFETPGISVSFLRRPSTAFATIVRDTGPTDLEGIQRTREIVALGLDDLAEPVRYLEIAIACHLGLPQRLDESVITDAIEFSRDCLKADVGHVIPPVLTFSSDAARVLLVT
jgi:hypothetical protein